MNNEQLPEDESFYNVMTKSEPGMLRKATLSLGALALGGVLLMAPSAFDDMNYKSNERKVEQIRGLRQKGDDISADYIVKDIRRYIDSSVRHPEHLNIPLSRVYELESKLSIADKTASTNVPEKYLSLPGTQMVPVGMKKK